MRYRQFIYTSYKKYRAEELGLSNGYDVFAKTEGITEEEGSELASLFLNYVVPNDPRLDDIDHIEENVKKYAPKQRAFLQLSNGKYCWCQVSLVPFDFTGRYNSIYFHAVLADEEPDFNPIEFFDNFEFRSDLTDDEFHARVAPPKLPIGSIDRSSMRRTTPNAKLNKDICKKLLTCILYSVRTGKPLFLNCKTEEAFDILKSALCLLPLPIAKKVFFSTYSSDEREDGKIYRVLHMGKDFNYEARLNNDYVVVADLETGKFSPHVSPDAFISRLAGYLYSNGAEAEKFENFYETYTGGAVDFDEAAMLNAYDFIYTDAYKRFDMVTMQSVIADKYVATVQPNLRASRYEEYMKSNRLTVQERGVLLNEVYKCVNKDVNILLGYVNELLGEVVKGNLTTANAEELLKRTFNADLKTVILENLQYFNAFLSSNMANETVFALSVNMLLSAERADRSKAEYVYKLLYNAMAADLNALTGRLLPALEESGYFTACAKTVFIAYADKKGVVYWLNFANDCADGKIRDIFLGYTLDYLNDDARLNALVADRATFSQVFSLLKTINGKKLEEDKIFALIKKILNIEVSKTRSVDNAVAVLCFYDVMTYGRMDVLYDVVVNVMQNGANAVFIKLAGIYKDDYIKSLAKGKYARYGEAIIANEINSASDFISRYVKNYYLKGIYKDSCNAIIEKIDFNGDENRKFFFYVDVFKEVAGENSMLPSATYSYITANLCRVSHANRAKISEVVHLLEKYTAKLDKVYGLELFLRLIDFNGKIKVALELEQYLVADIRLNHGDLFKKVLDEYYDVLVNISLTKVKKNKKSDLVVEVYGNSLTEEKCKDVWNKFFVKDKKAQLVYMLDLLMTDTVNGDDICSLLKYFYKQKGANKQPDAKLAAANKKYKEL